VLYDIAEKTLRLQRRNKKIIRLNVGDPDQSTHKEIVEAACESIKKGETKYSFASGEPELKQKLAEVHGVPPERVIITPGSKCAIFMISCALLRKGENVVIPSPHWTAYGSIIESVGAKTRFLETSISSKWRIEEGKLEQLIDEKTRLLILNNPNNPTSRVIPEKTVEKLVQLADDKDVMVLSDETYSDISFVKVKSVVDFGEQHALVNSFSKTYAMTGWRIGYCILPKGLADKLTRLAQLSFSNVPVFVQRAAMKALDLKSEISVVMREKYRQRARATCKMLAETKLEFTEPEAPFYLFPRLANLDSERLAMNLLDRGVAITPGTAFGPYREHFRIALTAPDKEIELGVKTLCEALE
jgi:aspartate aminotransferase